MAVGQVPTACCLRAGRTVHGETILQDVWHRTFELPILPPLHSCVEHHGTTSSTHGGWDEHPAVSHRVGPTLGQVALDLELKHTDVIMKAPHTLSAGLTWASQCKVQQLSALPQNVHEHLYMLGRCCQNFSSSLCNGRSVSFHRQGEIGRLRGAHIANDPYRKYLYDLLNTENLLAAVRKAFTVRCSRYSAQTSLVNPTDL